MEAIDKGLVIVSLLNAAAATYFHFQGKYEKASFHMATAAFSAAMLAAHLISYLPR